MATPYTVMLPGGGSMTVNASSPEAARENAGVGSNAQVYSGGHQTTTSGGTTAFNPNAYVGAGESGGSPTRPTNPGSPSTSDQQGYNQNAADLAFRVADAAAQQAYLRARLALDTDVEAHRKAEAAWRQTFDQAQADQSWAAKQAELTGVFNGVPTLAAQSEQNKTALGYLDLTSRLRGPNDPFQYLRTLKGTPQGMVDIVNAAAGRYQLGGNPSGEIADRATVGGQINNLNAATGYMGPAYAPGMGGVAGAQSYQPNQMATLPVQPPGVYSYGTPSAAYATSPGTTQMPDVSGLPSAGQIDSRAYNQMLPSQKAALWAAYEYGGPSGAMRPEDAQAMYAKSLPQYTGSLLPRDFRTGSVSLG